MKELNFAQMEVIEGEANWECFFVGVLWAWELSTALPHSGLVNACIYT